MLSLNSIIQFQNISQEDLEALASFNISAAIANNTKYKFSKLSKVFDLRSIMFSRCVNASQDPEPPLTTSVCNLMPLQGNIMFPN